MSDDGFPGMEVGLFDNLPTKPPKTRKDLVSRQASVDWGACPDCTAQKVGLVVQGSHVAWRDHSKRTLSGAPMQCRATGQRLCEAPARDISTFTGTPPPKCPCQT